MFFPTWEMSERVLIRGLIKKSTVEIEAATSHVINSGQGFEVAHLYYLAPRLIIHHEHQKKVEFGVKYWPDVTGMKFSEKVGEKWPKYWKDNRLILVVEVDQHSSLAHTVPHTTLVRDHLIRIHTLLGVKIPTELNASGQRPSDVLTYLFQRLGGFLEEERNKRLQAVRTLHE